MFPASIFAVGSKSPGLQFMTPLIIIAFMTCVIKLWSEMSQ
jgi:hypothetical protein